MASWVGGAHGTFGVLLARYGGVSDTHMKCARFVPQCMFSFRFFGPCVNGIVGASVQCVLWYASFRVALWHHYTTQ